MLSRVRIYVCACPVRVHMQCEVEIDGEADRLLVVVNTAFKEKMNLYKRYIHAKLNVPNITQTKMCACSPCREERCTRSGAM